MFLSRAYQAREAIKPAPGVRHHSSETRIDLLVGLRRFFDLEPAHVFPIRGPCRVCPKEPLNSAVRLGAFLVTQVAAFPEFRILGLQEGALQFS
jgi:hypothetical protein